MRKFFEKSEIWFAIMWIIIYVVGMSTATSISSEIGIPYLIPLLFILFLLAALLIFIRKNHLMEYWGLCKFKGSYPAFLFFIPLLAIPSVNFWNGVFIETTVTESLITASALGLAGIVEEIVFRGLLFKAISRTSVKQAMVISSLTFGIGHIVNLLNGAPVFDTLCQIIYACAIGFCFTIIFYTGRSIIPCMLTHAAINAASAFGAAPENPELFGITSTIFLTVVSTGYSIWLLYKTKKTALADHTIADIS